MLESLFGWLLALFILLFVGGLFWGIFSLLVAVVGIAFVLGFFAVLFSILF